MGNQLTKICETCGCEFKISKFQPYITNCKKHRSKITIKSNIKKRKKSKISVKSCCLEHMATNHHGMVVCMKCKEQFWFISDGIYRSFHKKSDGKYWVYKDGVRVGKYDTVKEIYDEFI